MRFPVSLKTAVAAVLALAAWPAVAEECATDRVDFRWLGGRAAFKIEIADTYNSRSLGLMYRKSLPLDAGMLFIYRSPQPVSFWMKNTLIPLDLLFIDENGKVTQIRRDARPGDLTPMPGPLDTLMVLEINGGLARRIGLPVDAQMRHPRLDQDVALWPCSEP
ncbi:MAG: DUF192 domain-containing protein [Paracoccaceae bacterium]